MTEQYTPTGQIRTPRKGEVFAAKVSGVWTPFIAQGTETGKHPILRKIQNGAT